MPIAIVTDLPFWQRGRGDATRIATLHTHLSAHAETHVVAVLSSEAGHPNPPPADLRLTIVPAQPGMPPKTLRAAVGRALAAIRPRATILQFARLSGFRASLPPGTPALLDLHNVYWAAAGNWHREPPPAPPRRREIEIDAWRPFDGVIAISAAEAALVSDAVGAARTLLCPHPVPVLWRAPFRPALRTIGILAGNTDANVEGIRWFAGKVLPRLPADMTLAVHGTIDPARLTGLGTRVRFAGPVPVVADALDAFDLFVNPAPWGTGMKIKSAEALAAGLPVVATPAGALGVEGAAGAGLIVAADAAAFAQEIRALADAPDRRAALSDAAQVFAREALSAERCFGPLLAALAISPGASTAAPAPP